MQKSITAVLAFLVLSSCEPSTKQTIEPVTNDANVLLEKDQLLGTWRFTLESWAKDRSIDYTNFSLSMNESDRYLMSIHISFFDDSTYTQIVLRGNWSIPPKSEYETGIYRLSKDSIFLTSSGGTTDVVKVATREKGKLFLCGGRYFSSHYRAFVRTSHPLSIAQNDPFHSYKTVWRNKPKRPENSKALKTRLRNILAYKLAVLEATTEGRKDPEGPYAQPVYTEVVHDRLGIIYAPYLDGYYYRCFFNAQQAIDACDLAKKAIVKASMGNNKRGVATSNTEEAILKEMISKL